MTYFHCKPDLESLKKVFEISKDEDIIRDYQQINDFQDNVIKSDHLNEIEGAFFIENFPFLLEKYNLKSHYHNILFLSIILDNELRNHVNLAKKKKSEQEFSKELAELVLFLSNEKSKDLSIKINSPKDNVYLKNENLINLLITLIISKLKNWDEPLLNYGELFVKNFLTTNNVLNSNDSLFIDEDQLKEIIKIKNINVADFTYHQKYTFVYTIGIYLHHFTELKFKRDKFTSIQKKFTFELLHILGVHEEVVESTKPFDDLIKNYNQKLKKLSETSLN